MKVKGGIEKYQTAKMTIGGQEFMVPCVACTPDEYEQELIASIEAYFLECQNGISFSDKLGLESELVKEALGIIYDDLPEIRINRGDFDRVLGQVSQGNLGEGSGVSQV